MSKPSFKITRSIRSQQVLNAFVNRVLKNLPFKRFLKNGSLDIGDRAVRSTGRAKRLVGTRAFVLSVLGAIVIISTGNMLSIAEFSGVSGAYAVEDFYFTTVPLGIIALICYFGGLLLFGIATLRAGVFPRWAGILLSVGAVVTFFGLSALPPLVLLLGVILLAIALAWMGWALWSKKGSVESQPKPAM